MTSTDKPEISFANLSLEPLEAASPATPAEPVKFHANTRAAGERRVQADRREVIRFQEDRRSGKDRRPKASWEPGSNL